MRDRIDDFVACKRIAVVGVSRSGRKFGNLAANELERRGYEVFPVHPSAAEIDGRPCARTLRELRGRIDAALVSLPPSAGEHVLRDAAAAGITRVWLQQGAESPELIELARDLGLEPVVERCLLMFAPPVRSIHRFHRGALRMFGRLYPKHDPFEGQAATT